MDIFRAQMWDPAYVIFLWANEACVSQTNDFELQSKGRSFRIIIKIMYHRLCHNSCFKKVSCKFATLSYYLSDKSPFFLSFAIIKQAIISRRFLVAVTNSRCGVHHHAKIHIAFHENGNNVFTVLQQPEKLEKRKLLLKPLHNGLFLMAF